MGLIEWIRSKLPTRCILCRKIYTLPFKVTVDGEKVSLCGSRFCPACAEKRLSETFTRCGTCGELILTGMPVCHAPKGAKYLYAHLSDNCSHGFGALLYCGVWGEGKLRTLGELFPDQFKDSDDHNVLESMMGERQWRVNKKD